MEKKHRDDMDEAREKKKSDYMNERLKQLERCKDKER